MKAKQLRLPGIEAPKKKVPPPPAKWIKPPDLISSHPNKCPCPRCVDLTECPVCKLHKLDTGDWCFNCGRLVF